MCACIGGPFLSRRREPPVAPRLLRGNIGRARPVRLQSGGSALAVAAPANCLTFAVRSLARLCPPPSAPWRADSDTHLRSRCAGKVGPPVVRNRVWAFPSHGTRIAGGAARADTLVAGELL